MLLLRRTRQRREFFCALRDSAAQKRLGNLPQRSHSSLCCTCGSGGTYQICQFSPQRLSANLLASMANNEDAMSIPNRALKLFYQNGYLYLESGADTIHSVFRNNGAPLAQRLRDEGGDKTALILGDQQNSVLGLLGSLRADVTYTPYGYAPFPEEQRLLLGFNGHYRNLGPVFYFLGNGYRVYSSILMRFFSSDSWSPFGDGGLNAYNYCAGDPVNMADASGHMPKPVLRGRPAARGRHHPTSARVEPNATSPSRSRSPLKVKDEVQEGFNRQQRRKIDGSMSENHYREPDTLSESSGSSSFRRSSWYSDSSGPSSRSESRGYSSSRSRSPIPRLAVTRREQKEADTLAWVKRNLANYMARLHINSNTIPTTTAQGSPAVNGDGAPPGMENTLPEWGLGELNRNLRDF